MSKTPQFFTMAAKHAKCPNDPCVGPGCRYHRVRVNTCEPRKRTSPTKAERRLAARVGAFEQHGSNPPAPNNPSNSSGRGHDMLKPGSQKKK